jgi:hypothetical protein
MNVEIGAEAALFPEKEYIAVAVQGVINREAKVRQKNQKWPLKQCTKKTCRKYFTGPKSNCYSNYFYLALKRLPHEI